MALKGHWHDAHSNVGWPDEFETKLTEEKGLQSFKVSRNVGKLSYRKWVLLALVIIILVGITASALRQGNQTVSTTTTSSVISQISSTTSPLLSANDFSITPTMGTCGFRTNGLKFDTLQAQLQNDKNHDFSISFCQNHIYELYPSKRYSSHCQPAMDRRKSNIRYNTHIHPSSQFQSAKFRAEDSQGRIYHNSLRSRDASSTNY